MSSIVRFRAFASIVSVFALGLTASLPLTGEEIRFPGADAKWKYYQLGLIEVYSRETGRFSLNLLLQLERMNHVFFTAFGFKRQLPKPLTVILTPSDRAIRHYLSREAVDRSIGAYYINRADRGVLLVHSSAGLEENRELLIAAYTYHLFSLLGEDYPNWAEIGFAALFSTLEFHPNFIALGKIDDERAIRLANYSFLPWERVFTAKSSAEFSDPPRAFSQYHDQAAILIHYLLYGDRRTLKSGPGGFMNEVLARGRRMEAKEMEAATVRWLGLDFKNLTDELEAYMRGGRYHWVKLPPPPGTDPATIPVRAVALAEINARLAELEFRISGSDRSRAFLEAAVAQKEGRALEVMGAVAFREKQFDRGAEYWAKAIERGQTNPLLEHRLGQARLEKALAAFAPTTRLDPVESGILRTQFLRSLEAVPEQSEAYEGLVWTEALAGNPLNQNINLVQRQFEHLRDKQGSSLVALAWIRHRNGMDEEAAELLEMTRELYLSNQMLAIVTVIQGELARIRKGQGPRTTGSG